MRVTFVEMGRVFIADAEVAATPDARTRGLSGRESLPFGRAMLFAFPADVQVDFSTQAMRFPIDMLFLDAHGRIVWMIESMAPGNSFPIHSPVPFRYVLELPAWWMRAHGLTERAGVAWHPRQIPGVV